MSYTAPDYVDTKSQAILALASVIADEDKTALGDGSVNKALDVLADVLAETDVQVPQTNAGAILALAQYAGGMVKPEGTITITENGEGIDVAQYATADVSVSGGVSVGDAIPVVYANDAPVVGTSDYAQDASFCVVSVMIGDSLIAHNDSGESTIEFVAAGCTVIIVNDQSGIKLYKCTCSGSLVNAATELTSVEVTTEDYGGGYYGHTFTIPDTLATTEALWITPAID